MSCGYRRIQNVVDIWNGCYKILEDSRIGGVPLRESGKNTGGESQ